MAQQKNWYDDDQANPNSGAGTVLAGNNNVETGNGQTAGNATGSGFDNLNKYIGANAGQGAGFADAVTGIYKGAVDDNTKAANDYVTGAKSQVDSSTYKADPSFSANLSAAARSGATGNENNPNNPAATLYNNEKGKSAYTGNTDGSSFNNYADILSKFKSTGDDLKDLSGDRESQKAALQKNSAAIGATGQYNNGMANLDSFLLANDPESASKFQSNVAGLQAKSGAAALDPYTSQVSAYAGGAAARGDAAKKSSVDDAALARYNELKAKNSVRGGPPIAVKDMQEEYTLKKILGK